MGGSHIEKLQWVTAIQKCIDDCNPGGREVRRCVCVCVCVCVCGSSARAWEIPLACFGIPRCPTQPSSFPPAPRYHSFCLQEILFEDTLPRELIYMSDESPAELRKKVCLWLIV